MRISELDQLDADIDWFATDAAGHVLHIASGGGSLPASVAADEQALLALHAYLLELPATTTAAPGEAGVSGSPQYPGHARYARRGLYSFAKTQLQAPADTTYTLMARPVLPLTLTQLPPALAEQLARTRFPARVADQSELNLAQLP